MIKTVPLDIPVNFFIGGLIALAAGRGIRAGDDILGRHFKLAAGYSIWFGLTVTWFFFRYPDWMYAYFLPVRWPMLVFGWPAFMTALAVAGGLGALATAVWIKRWPRPWIPALYGLINWALIFWFQFDQYFHIGDYQQYHAGAAVPLKEHLALRQAMNIAGPLEIVPVALILIYLWFVNRKRIPVEAAPTPGTENERTAETM